MIYLDPLVSTVRIFRGGHVYGDPYDAVATIVICGDLAYLCGLHGELTREDWLAMQAELRARGVRDLLTIRHGERIWYAADHEGHQRGRFPRYDQSGESAGASRSTPASPAADPAA